MKRTAAAAALILMLLSGAAMAYTSGVPTGLSGAPGDETCANCHDNLNNGSGWISVTAPPDYSAGETIDITVQVGHNGQRKWGFTLTALDDSNQPVGSFTVTDAVRTQLDVDGDTGREYMMHTAAGTDEEVLDQSNEWTFQWTAPASRAGVTFYACGVAANNASGTNGDFCYTEALNLSETAVSNGFSWGRIKGLFQ
jgi:hypothetical protein